MNRTLLLKLAGGLVLGVIVGVVVGAITDGDDDAPSEAAAAVDVEPPALPPIELPAEVLDPVSVGAPPSPPLLATLGGAEPAPEGFDPEAVPPPPEGDATSTTTATTAPTDPDPESVEQPQAGQVDIASLVEPASTDRDDRIVEVCAADDECLALADDLVERILAPPPTEACLTDDGCPDAPPTRDRPGVDELCGPDPECALLVPAILDIADETSIPTTDPDIATIDDPTEAELVDDAVLGALLGFLGTEGLPYRIDPCLLDDAPDTGCPGVGATVLASIEAPLIIGRVTTQPRLPVECVQQDTERPTSGEVVFVVESNQPGAFRLEYLPFDADPAAVQGEQLTGQTNAVQAESFLGLPEEQPVRTCLVGAVPSPEPSHVRVQAVGTPLEGDADDGLWSGIVGMATPVARDADTLRGDRPPISVSTIGSRTVQARIPTGPGELASALLVRRDPAAPDADRCAAAERGEFGPRDGRLPMRELQVTSGRGGEYPNLVVVRGQTLVEETPVPYDVCVRWFDQLSPPRIVERARVTVVPPAQAPVDVLVGPADGADDWVRGGSVALEINECDVTVDLPVDPALDPVCSGNTVGGRALFGVLATPTAPDGTEGTRSASFLSLDASSCIGADPAACETWFVVPLEGTDGQVGTLSIGLRPTSVNFGADWTVSGADEAYVLEGEPDLPPLPRMDLDAFTLEPDPDDPARSAIATWRSDEPVRARLELRSMYGDVRCSDAERLVASSSELATSGRLRISGDLCPGTTYGAALSLTTEDVRRRTYVSSSAFDVAGAGVLPIDARIQTAPVTLDLDFEIRPSLLLEDARTEGTLVPLDIYLRIDDDEVDQFHQWHRPDDERVARYRAYFGMVCEPVRNLVRTGDVGTGEFGMSTRLELVYATAVWESARTCPDFANQARGDGRVSPANGVSLVTSLPVDEIIRTGRAVLTTRRDYLTSRVLLDADGNRIDRNPSPDVEDTSFPLYLEVDIVVTGRIVEDGTGSG